MSVRAAIVAILAAAPAVQAIAGDRIRPLKLGQKDDGTRVLVNATEMPWTSLEDGTPASGSASVVIECISRDSDEQASQLAAAVLASLWRGRVGADRRITGVWQDPVSADVDPSPEAKDNDDDYIETVTLTVHWERVTP